MPKRPPSHLHRSGLTLVEMLVAVAVLGVLLAVAIPSLVDMMERRRIAAVAGELAGIFNYAKSEANVFVSQDQLTLHLEPMTDMQASCARLVTASLFDNCSCGTASADVCSQTSKMLRELIVPKDTGISFEAAGDWGAMDSNVVYFSRNAHFNDVSNVRVTVKGQRTGAQLQIQYNSIGRVRTCSPGGTMSGYPACG